MTKDGTANLTQTYDIVRDLETIPMTRGQLVQLLVRLFIAEGMATKQAEIHARMHVDHAFVHLKSGARS